MMEKQRRDRLLRECMTRSLREWGVARNQDFAEKVREEAICQTDAVSTTFPLLLESLKRNDLPNDQEQAIKYVLRKDLQDALDEDGVEVVRDTLGIPWPPYRPKNKDTNTTDDYIRSNGYEKFSQKEMDPLNRFSFETIPDQQDIFVSWSDRDCLEGTVMEALVADHVVHFGSCFHCKARDQLRWNGGRDLDSSWADLICLHCQSTYEVKSKKAPCSVAKIFQNRILRGGYFRLFRANQLKGKGNRYVVLVSRAANDRGEYPVSIREIDCVEPVLKDVSFANHVHGDKHISLGTRVRIKDQKQLWCTIPRVTSLQPGSWAREVFDEHFGPGTWDSWAGPSSVAEVKAPLVSEKKAEALRKDDFEELKRALQEVCTENWEDSEDEPE